MKNIRPSVLWIMSVVFLILGGVLIFACSKVDDSMSTVLVIITAIDFILMTFTLQAASFKSFKYNPKKHYVKKEYEGSFSDLRKKLDDNKFSCDKHKYGTGHLLIRGKDALKVTLISDPMFYFDQPEQTNESKKKTNRDLDKCERFIGIEIFEMIDEEHLNRLDDFTIQAKNVYFTALLNQENNRFVCTNYEEPADGFKDGYNFIFEALGIKDKVSE